MSNTAAGPTDRLNIRFDPAARRWNRFMTVARAFGRVGLVGHFFFPAPVALSAVAVVIPLSWWFACRRVRTSVTSNGDVLTIQNTLRRYDLRTSEISGFSARLIGRSDGRLLRVHLLPIGLIACDVTRPGQRRKSREDLDEVLAQLNNWFERTA